MTSWFETQAKLEDEWTNVCQSKNHTDIISFFDQNKENMLSAGTSWFILDLIKEDDIKTMQYIFQHSMPEQYINVEPINKQHKDVLDEAVRHSKFETIRFLISNGADWPYTIGVRTLLRENRKMTDEELYLCVKYLLTHSNREMDAILYFLAGGDDHSMRIQGTMPTFDRIKMANLINSKRPSFQNSFREDPDSLASAIGRQYFKFAEYMIEHGATLSPKIYIWSGCNISLTDVVVKWLLKHNVDINGEMQDHSYKGRTPLFQHCLDKNYAQIELLLDNGADINKKCKYEDKMMSSLELCKETLPTKYYEYFLNYNRKKSVFDIEFSKIPKTPFKENVSFNDESRINELNDQCMNKHQEIVDLEKVLNIKYNELKDAMHQKNELVTEKQTIEKWNEMKESWMAFLKGWKRWDTFCFSEYLKRCHYAEKSYDIYYSSDSDCMQKIEDYIQQNSNKFSLDVHEQKHAENEGNALFKGDYLETLDATAIMNIGITANQDMNSVYSDLQELTQSIKQSNVEAKAVSKVQRNDNESNTELRNWLTNVVKLPQYFDTFVSNDISLDIMGDITKEDLKDMGIKSIGHIRIILKCATAVKQEEGAHHSTDYI
eukprot:145801_1